MRRWVRTLLGWGVGSGLCLTGVVLKAQESVPPQEPARAHATPSASSGPRSHKTVLLAQLKKRGRTRPKKGAPAKPEAPDAAKAEKTPGPAAGLLFSKDIAPILVGNCIECHNPERRRGKFDLTTFQKLMTGSEKRKVIVPGKPEESSLVLHIKGEEDPKMPPGNNRNLAPEAITKIETWVKAGARLDAGVDPNALLRVIAPTADDQKRAALAKLTPAERDKKLKEAAEERFKKAGAKTAPEMTSSAHFVLFANLPKDRAQHALRLLESAALQLNRMLSRSTSEPALDFSEKVSVYVFKDAGPFAEFSRGVENREVEQGDEAHANLGVDEPYLAAVDPLAGREDESLKKRASRGRKGSRAPEEPGGPERSLEGLLVEQLAAGALARAGKAPEWLRYGLGAAMAAQVEPHSPYFRRLREAVAQEYTLGWSTKAQEALGNQTSPDKVRAIGFSLVEWLSTTQRAQYPVFVRGIAEEPQKLDDSIKSLWGVTREEFLRVWGQWVARRYGATR